MFTGSLPVHEDPPTSSLADGFLGPSAWGASPSCARGFAGLLLGLSSVSFVKMTLLSGTSLMRGPGFLPWFLGACALLPILQSLLFVTT